LEKPGLVVIGEPVSVDVVLSAEEYWNPPVEEESKWLVEQILPRVKQYLAAHRKHGIIYIEDDLVFDPEGLCADWVEVKTAYIDVAPRKR
jgi:hypothetical protein